MNKQHYCAKGAVGSKPEVCIRVRFLRVHHPPLLKAAGTYNWQTRSPHLHPQDYVPSKSWGKHSSVRHCWFFERGCCKFGEHCPFSHKTWQKDPEKKSKQVTLLACLFFRVSCFAWTVAGDGERGLSNRAQHQKWLPKMLDCWFLMHVGWTTCSFWNVALLSSIHLPCMVTIFGPGGLKRLRSNLVKHSIFATWCLLNSYLTRSPAQSPKSSPSKMSPPFCTPFELASPPGPLEKTRCTCKSTHLPQGNPSHHQQMHAHIHTNIYVCIYINIYIYLILHMYIYIYISTYTYTLSVRIYLYIHNTHPTIFSC